jgi:1,4-dihydroxy-2-naphthoate octaprenyltransferase
MAWCVSQGYSTTDAVSFAAVGAALVRMSRPAQLSLIVLVYGLGVLLALARGAEAAPGTVVLGFLALLPAALSVHYVNEYADFETDALSEGTPFSGGSGALQNSRLTRSFARDAAVVTVLLVPVVLLLGAVADVRLPSPALALLAAILLLGWGYSVGPAFAWNGLGELANALVGGVLLPLFGVAVTAGGVSLPAVLAVLPFGIVLFCNLLATHWPDRDADAAVGKETLATRWSRRRLRVAYGAAVVLYVAFVALLWGDPLPFPVAFASAMVVPHLLWGFSQYTVRESPAPTVGAMASLATLQTIGWAVAG